MGMYDTFVGEHLCPNCKLYMYGCEAQTKEFECLLHAYYQGTDMINLHGELVREASFPALAECKKCGNLWDTYIYVKRGVFVGFTDNPEQCPIIKRPKSEELPEGALPDWEIPED